MYVVCPMILCLAVTRLLPDGYLRLRLRAHRNHDGKKSHSLSVKTYSSLLEACDKLTKTSQRDASAKLRVPQANLCVVYSLSLKQSIKFSK